MGRWVRIVSAVGLLSSVMALGGPAGAQTPGGGCSEPYPPVWGPAAGLPEIDASEVPVQAAGVRFELNDAGTARVVSGPPSNEVVVQRPSGELRVTSSEDILGYSAGDLDGDGNDEVWVSSHNVSPSRSWIVPFDTPDGTVDVTTAGIEVTPGTPRLSVPAATGENLVIENDWEIPDGAANGTTFVLDGAAILAVGAGGDATGVPALAEYAQRSPVGLVSFDEGSQLVLTRLSLTPDSAQLYTSVAEDGSETVFSVGGQLRNDGNRTATPSTLGALEGSAGRFLRVTSYGFPPTQYQYLWSYDDPCRSLEVAATPSPTTAPPAAAPLALTG